MTHSVYLVSKFHETKKGVTLYFAKGSCKDIWTGNKMEAAIYINENDASDIAIKHKAFVSTVPILL